MYRNCAVLVFVVHATAALESNNLLTGCREEQMGKPVRHKFTTKIQSTLQLKTEGWESG